jgi:hypothetical protein
MSNVQIENSCVASSSKSKLALKAAVVPNHHVLDRVLSANVHEQQ